MGEAPTPSQTVGPFFGFALPFPSDAQAVAPEAPGALRVEGQLIDGAGDPVPDGLLEAWEGDQFARCGTDPEGMFHFVVRKPAPGPDGHAPHLNVTVFARGLLRHLTTRLYFPDEAGANAADPALNAVEPERRHTLVARDDSGVLRFDVRLQGEEETVFFAV
ncbi:MAG TPA: protocatechuate 3,4-dioxygenase subunit alpha [Candidatus Dormibacteraeota bacterium]|nr:protocatechuate 3,4-dioxygenase subunit alpha [Candidatus Dormibacteraeota bacterium]